MFDISGRGDSCFQSFSVVPRCRPPNMKASDVHSMACSFVRSIGHSRVLGARPRKILMLAGQVLSKSCSCSGPRRGRESAKRLVSPRPFFFHLHTRTCTRCGTAPRRARKRTGGSTRSSAAGRTPKRGWRWRRGGCWGWGYCERPEHETLTLTIVQACFH